MAQRRGRKSSAELEIAGNVEKLDARPLPPDSLSDRGQDIWLQVVNSMPSDWFKPETRPLLQMYCEHVVESEIIQIMINNSRTEAHTNPKAYRHYTNLLKQKELQTRAALSCATKMRFTQQSTYNAKSGATAKNNIIGGSTGKPWD